MDAARAAGAGMRLRMRQQSSSNRSDRSRAQPVQGGELIREPNLALDAWPVGLPKPSDDGLDRGRHKFKRGGVLGPVLNPKRPQDHAFGIDWEWAGFRGT